MARELSRAEAFERVHEVYSQINFNAFDYDSIKQSLIEHTRIFFPEDFSDYIEQSEFIAILELFAYVGELISYRLDINAHENFLSTAQRKESVLRLAKMLSYDVTRNLPCRGLVKITSVRTTDNIFDSQSRNLSGRTIRWNDPNNIDWKEQFIAILNKVLNQEYGTVSPSDRKQIDNVLYEKYQLNNNPLGSQSTVTIPYSVNVSGASYPMELVPASLGDFGPEETRPTYNGKFSLLYLNDGLGDGSDSSGFMVLTKQGTLQRKPATFDGVTPNNTLDLLVDNINNIDLYVNNVDPATRQILLGDNGQDIGSWQPADLSTAKNIAFNSVNQKKYYEVETLANDQVRLVFGDGLFAEIPSGAFDVWFRTSANENLTIPRNAVTEETASISYVDPVGNVQTITFTFSLTGALQNGSASETLEHIKKSAPNVYYTQNRMVNGQDYNSFMLQDPSILRLKAINRTFTGDSKYTTWHDPREKYEDVKLFGDDLAIFWEEKSPLNGHLKAISSPYSSSELITQEIQPALSDTNFFSVASPYIYKQGKSLSFIRREFTPVERSLLTASLDRTRNGDQPYTDLYFQMDSNNLEDGGQWLVDPSIAYVNSTALDPRATFMYRIEAVFNVNVLDGWIMRSRTKELVAHSESMRFWSVNEPGTAVSFDTLNQIDDKIVVLAANANAEGTGLLQTNQDFVAISKRHQNSSISSGGLTNIHELNVFPSDANNDGFPDDISIEAIFGEFPVSANSPSQSYVYFSRETIDSQWIPQPTSNSIIAAVDADNTKGADERLFKREIGRYPLNFAWMHTSPELNLVDPAKTNIIDMFVVTVNYYNNLRRYLGNQIDNAPQIPTPNELRDTYRQLLKHKMISDTVVIRSGDFKILFGPRAIPSLQGRFKVVKSSNSTKTDNDIKNTIVSIVREYFDINTWEFGETLYITELLAAIHTGLQGDIDSVVIVPSQSNSKFGDLFEIQSADNELMIADINVSDIDMVDGFTSTNIKQFC